MSQQYDFVAIGDITIDAFIQLSKDDASVLCNIDGKPCQLVMDFGSKLPYEDVTVVNAVGNAPNASVSAHRLGLSSALVTNLGHDRNGKDCLTALRNEGVHTDFVKVHEEKNTNYHYVLRYGAERTILIKHEEYPYALPKFATPPRYIYFSSIGENGVDFHHEIASYVKAHPETKLVFQPGTFQIRLGYEAIKDIYEVCEIFFCNKQEAEEILGVGVTPVPELLRKIAALGPKIPVITDGPNGAFALEGDHVWFIPMYPDLTEPIDRTGAGDSFSSTFTAALARGHDIKTALTWGPISSMSVVQHIGAQKGLPTEDALMEYLKNAPADYVPKKI